MKRKYYRSRLSICLILFVCSFLWLFEGIIGKNRLTSLSVFCGVMLLCSRKIKLSKSLLIWLLYILAIVMSYVVNKTATRWGLYCLKLYLPVILCAVFIKCSFSVFKTGICFLMATGAGNAFMVLVHFFLDETYNKIYFPFLKHNSSFITASTYYRRGYYFGLNYKPHETAGIIIFSLAAFLIWGMVQTNARKKLIYILPCSMLLPLLLTGKKGAFVCMFAALLCVVCLWYMLRKQEKKIILTMIGATALLIVSVCYILTHLDNPLFYRFSMFFINLSQGKSVDAGRGSLRDAAWQLWKENKLFGVGWFRYNGYTVSRFGFSSSHSVNLDYLQFLCETGIFGFTLMIIPIIIMLRNTVLVCKKVLKTVTVKQIQWIILFAVFVQIFTVLYAFIEVPFYNFMYFTVYIFSCMIINHTLFHNAGCVS